MTVAELIDFLSGLPQDSLVAYELYSEQCLLDPKRITEKELCEPRPDGWIQNKRPDKPSVKYVVFPGN